MRLFYFQSALRAAAFLLALSAFTALAQKPLRPRDGVFHIFHPTAGFIILEEHYKDGRRHGPSLEFNKDGIIRESNYKEGKPDGFWRQFEKGVLASETNYKDGKPEGATFVRLKDYEMSGQYVNGKPDGVWTERRPEVWEFVKRYKNGLPHGLWERKNKDGKETLRLTFEKGTLVDKGDALKAMPYLQKVSDLAKDGKDLLAKRALAMLEADVDLDYRQTPIKEVVEDLRERFQVPMYVDIQALNAPNSMEVPTTINEKQVQFFLGLYEIGAEHELIFDYRFHSFWLTTPKALAAWKDTTGVSDLKPAPGSPLAKALPDPAKFDVLGTSISGLAERLQKEHGVSLDASSAKDAEWHQREQRPLPGVPQLSLQDALFITLYLNQCHCREEGGKLIIEPLETKKP